MIKKELQNKYPKKRFGVVYIYRDSEFVNIDKNRVINHLELDFLEIKDMGWEFFHLNNTGIEWRIGNLDEVEELCLNLTRAIKHCKENP